jgi:hypothetical protein
LDWRLRVVDSGALYTLNTLSCVCVCMRNYHPDPTLGRQSSYLSAVRACVHRPRIERMTSAPSSWYIDSTGPSLARAYGAQLTRSLQKDVILACCQKLIYLAIY